MSSFIDQVIERANIVDIISKYVSLKKVGANYFGLCPFHPDKHPSMSVSSKKKLFKCFSCNISGNVITFVQKLKKISFGEALKQVALDAGFSQKEIDDYFNNKHSKNYNPYQSHFYALNEKANELFQILLFNSSNNKYLDYLKQRKLSESTLKYFNVGFCGKDGAKTILFDLLTTRKDGNESFNADDLLKASLININEKTSEITDYFFNRITFPIKDKNGFIIGFIGRSIVKTDQLKYLSSRETILFHKSNVFYNLDQIYNSNIETLIILEGNIDLISLYEAGLDFSKFGVVALMGTAFTTNHLSILKSIKSLKNIILCLDNDDAGTKNSLSIGLQLLKNHYQTFVVKNATKYKDINDILVNEGKKQVLTLFNDENLVDFITFYISNMLNSLSVSNTTHLVEQVLKLISKYGNTLYWKKYRDLICSLTKLDSDDLNSTYKRIASNRFAIKNDDFLIDNNKKYQHKVNSEEEKLYKSLKNVINEILIMIFSDASLAKSIYLELEHKTFNHKDVQDVLTFIKNVPNWCNSDSTIDFKKNLLSLFNKQLIGEKAYRLIDDCFNSDNSIKKKYHYSPSTKKSRVTRLIENFDSLCWKIQIIQYNEQLKTNKNLSSNERDELKNRINKVKNKLTKIKKTY